MYYACNMLAIPDTFTFACLNIQCSYPYACVLVFYSYVGQIYNLLKKVYPFLRKTFTIMKVLTLHQLCMIVYI